jgi:hypothetical protein
MLDMEGIDKAIKVLEIIWVSHPSKENILTLSQSIVTREIDSILIKDTNLLNFLIMEA